MTLFAAMRSMTNKNRWIFGIAMSTLLTVLPGSRFSGDSFAASQFKEENDFVKLGLIELKPPTEAPEFVLDSLAGKRVSLQSFRGKPLMLYFWATW